MGLYFKVCHGLYIHKTMVCISSCVHRSPNYVLKGAKIVFGVGPEELIEVKIRTY